LVIDTSAILAILQLEPEAERFARAIQADSRRRMAAPTLLELSLVAEGRSGERGADALDALLARIAIEVVPFTATHATLARDAWRRFGKGRHPAGLNLGDCISHALARATGEPLLFKGQDFPLTDVQAAVPPTNG
jgi:ribonuclease VapC